MDVVAVACGFKMLNESFPFCFCALIIIWIVTRCVLNKKKPSRTECIHLLNGHLEVQHRCIDLLSFDFYIALFKSFSE